MTISATSAAAVQSPQSIALESLDRIRELLIKNPPTVQVDAAAAAEPKWCHPQERTDNRLRAYMASVHSLSGSFAREHERGAVLIERLALSAESDDPPTLLLTPEECADVLAYMNDRTPVDGRSWWADTQDGPSHVCGFHILLGALEDSLRAVPAAAPEESLRDSEATKTEPRTWHDVTLGSIADMISSQPGDAEAKNTGPAAPSSGGDELVSAATLIRTAIGLYANEREPADADRSGIQRGIDIAAESLTKWAEVALEADDDRLDDIYDVIDGLTVAAALLKASDLKPSSRVTTAPIAGTLRLALARLEAVSQGSPEAADAAIHPSLAEYILQQQDRARELQDLLERLAGTYDDDNGALDAVARFAGELNEALDSIALDRVIAAKESRP